MENSNKTKKLVQSLLGDDLLKHWAWNNVPLHPSYPDGSMKIDAHGNWIKWSDYGERGLYGWQVDHYPIPKALGGGDSPTNVRALHHRKNASLGGLLGDMLRQ